MRIALLSMIEPADGGLPLRRAFLRVGGKSLAYHQVELALSCECERIVCIAKAIDPELIALQHVVERAGKAFHAIATPKELAGLVMANDELLIISDGLLVSPENASPLIMEAGSVLVQPVEAGIRAGFERLDLNNASAGILRVPGRLVEPLFDLPSDCDVPSSLTRIALQAGVPMREVPSPERSGGRWLMITSETEAYAAEEEWLARRIEGDDAGTPGRWLSHYSVRTFGSSLLHYGHASKAVMVAAFAAIALGLGWAQLGSAVVALLFCGASWVFLRTAELLNRIEQGPATGKLKGAPRLGAIEWLIDMAIAAILIWKSQSTETTLFLTQIFPPLMLMLMVRLVARLDGGVLTGWMGDRAVLAVLLAAAAAAGILHGAVPVLAILLAGAGLVFTAEKRG